MQNQCVSLSSSLQDTPLRYVFLGISGGIILLFGIPIFVLIAVGCI